MYPGATERFHASVWRSGHVAIYGVDLELADGTRRALRLEDGSVTEDALATERWALDATVIEPDLTGLDLDSDLVPGSILRPWRGLRYPDGTEERIPLGVMLLGAPAAELGDGSLSVAGEGRSTAIGQAQLVTPWAVTAGELLSEVVSALLADRLPGCPGVVLGATDVTLAATFIPAGPDTDPWTALTSEDPDTPGLVFSSGRRLAFDADGVPVLRNLSSTSTPIEVDGGLLTQTGRTSLDPSRTYGRVVVNSNALGDDTPLQAIEVDPAPLVPALARRVYWAQLDDLASQAAVDEAAGALLAEVTGIYSQASWEWPPNPALQAGDVVNITGGPLEGTFEIARIRTPLGPGLQQIDAVERVVS